MSVEKEDNPYEPAEETGAPNSKNAQQKSLTSRTVRGMAWMIGSSACQVLLKIFFFILLARLLSPADYGVAGAALVIIGFATIFSQVGVGQALIYQPNLNDRQIASANLVSILLGLLVTLLLIAAAPLAAWFFEDPNVTGALRLTACAFILRGVSTVAESLLERDLEFQAIAFRDVLTNLVGQGVVGLPLAMLGFNYWALCWAFLAGELLRTVFLLLRKPHARKLKGSLDVKGLVRFGSGMSVTVLVNRLAIQLDTILVGRFLGTEMLGFYGRAHQLAAMPASMFGKVYSKVLFPAMNSVREDQEKLRHVHSEVISALSLVVLPATLAAFFVAPHIIPMLIGEKWAMMIEPFQILVLGVYFRLGYKVSDVLMKSKGQVYRLALMHGFYALYVLVLVWVGVQFGLRGVAIGILCSVILQFIGNTIMGMRISGLRASQLAGAHVPGLCHSALVVVLGIGTTLITQKYELAPIWFIALFIGALSACHLAGMAVWRLRWFGVAGKMLESRLRLAFKPA